MYQPLDILILEIVKEKMRKYPKLYPSTDHKMGFKYTYRTMIHIWKEINNKTFKDAWNIPGLLKEIHSLQNVEEDEEYENQDKDYDVKNYSEENFEEEGMTEEDNDENKSDEIFEDEEEESLDYNESEVVYTSGVIF